MRAYRFLLSGLLSLVTALAQPMPPSRWGAPRTTTYPPEVTGGRNQTWGAVQDARGVLYFANGSGVLTFDGTRWGLIPIPDNVVVRSLALDETGTLYWGGLGKFGRLIRQPDGTLQPEVLSTQLKGRPDFQDVWSIQATPEGVYFFTWMGVFRSHRGQVTSLGRWIVGTQTCTLSGFPVFIDNKMGLCLIQDGALAPLLPLQPPQSPKRIRLFTRFDTHRLLLSCVDGTFQLLDLSSAWNAATGRYQVSAPLEPTPFPTTFDGQGSDKRHGSYRLHPVGDHLFGAGTMSGGLVLFDRRGQVVQVLNEHRGLADNNVLGFFPDREGDIWVFTSSGITHAETSLPLLLLDRRNGLQSFALTAIEHQGRFYVGTFNGLLTLETETGDLAQDRAHLVPVSDVNTDVWQFLSWDGDLYAATGSGLARIRGRHADVFQDPSAQNSSCLAASPRHKDHLFLGTMGGVAIYRRQGSGWVGAGMVKGVPGVVRTVAFDAQGRLWVRNATQGLFRLTFSTGDLTRPLVERMGGKEGLPTSPDADVLIQGNQVYFGNGDHLQVATVGGPDPVFRPESTFQSQAPEGFKLTWLAFASDGGVLMESRDDLLALVPQPDGRLVRRSYRYRGRLHATTTLWVGPGGLLWAGGRQLLRMEPRLEAATSPWHALVSAATTANGQRLSLVSTPPADLPFQHRSLTFEVAAPWFQRTDMTEFQVRLDGFDSGWSAWSTRTRKEYTNLPEGQYVFRVRARNLIGSVSDEGRLAFSIRPPWYRTWWARLIFVMGGTGGLLGLIRLYTWRLHRQKAVLERLVAKRTQELKDASLTDPLTGLRNRRFVQEILHHDIEGFLNFKRHVATTPNRRKTPQDDQVFGVFLMDLDHFKRVNDTYGHDAGDQVLKQFAAILKAAVRADDAVVRFGGEEFLVVLKKTEPAYLETFAARLLQQVATHAFRTGDGQTLSMTCSIGLAAFPMLDSAPDQLSFEQTAMVSDLALYRAKHDGRNRAVALAAGPGMAGMTPEETVLLGALDKAEAQGLLVVQATLLGPGEAS